MEERKEAEIEMLVSVVTTIGLGSCISVAVAAVHTGSGDDLKTEPTTEEDKRRVNGWFLLLLVFLDIYFGVAGQSPDSPKTRSRTVDVRSCFLSPERK